MGCTTFVDAMIADLSAVLGCRIEDLPAVFRNGQVPLKKQIYTDLVHRYPDLNVERARRWMKAWTGQRQYVLAIKAGGHRHDLDGTPMDLINDGDREHAAGRLTGAPRSTKSQPYQARPSRGEGTNYAASA
jgi:sRNA-binding protein